MNEGSPAASGWFADAESRDSAGVAAGIRNGSADAPADWPTIAVESGFADSETEYYDRLRAASIDAARAEVSERERAGDQQLIHAVRAMDDCERTANELAERVAEWAGSLYDDAGTGVGYAREIAAWDADGPAEARLVELATRCADLADEADALRGEIERTAPEVATNLSTMAGPVLAARLIALSGGLASLAKSPSSTVQVLGAEDALFAHLRGEGPSPKHGVIFTHEYVRGTHPEHRGSAARAFAGKLTLAARVDHYSGERRPELQEQLEERMERIRARTGDGGSADAAEDENAESADGEQQPGDADEHRGDDA